MQIVNCKSAAWHREVSAYFHVLAEPTRLRLLNLLRQGEHNVGTLAQGCGCSAANVSRHLALLERQGLVARESRGSAAYFRVADESVYALCDLVCSCIARRFEQHQATTARAFRARR